ncbi:MAG: hypothetical protein AAF735_01170 [Myxococcota bacterium]
MRSTIADIQGTLYAVFCLLAAFVFAVVVTAGSTKWMPPGRGGIDHIIVPVVLFPVIWIVFVVPLYVARRRFWAWAVAGAITLVHLGLAVQGLVS